jgi:amino acid transporter
VWSLVVQGCLSLAIVLFAGSFINAILYTAPLVWAFFIATGLSLFVLRQREPSTLRPYRVTGYPFTPIIFSACAIFMFYSSVSYAMANKPVGLIVLLSVLIAGIIVYCFIRLKDSGFSNENKEV